MDYIITGLPRSRKAWLANYFTFGENFCAFEPFRDGTENLARYLPSDYKVMGAADSSAAFFQDWIIHNYPQLKWVLIIREPKDSAESIKRLGLHPSQQFHDASVKLAELRAKVDPMVIPFEKLDYSLDAIEDYLGIHVDSNRRNMLSGMNVKSKEVSLSDARVEVEKAGFTPNNREYMGLLWEICKPNAQAYKWLAQLTQTALVWDHVVDYDPIDLKMTDSVFKALLLEWSLNTFWQTNHASLLPVMSSAISNWQCSYLNEMSKDKAYQIYEDVPAAVAFILGGQERVDRYLPRLRILVHRLRLEDDMRDGDRK